jgi:Dolichyl-phosphate-mannose-protein mannosyltransferase
MKARFNQRWLSVLLLIMVAVAIIAPRAPALNRFVTADEWAWVGRSAGFYTSFRLKDFAGTFQHSHPGVTAMWAGTLAYLWRYPGLVWDATPTTVDNFHRLERFLKARGRPAMLILESARYFMVIGTTLALVLAFLATKRLFGIWPALVGLLLIAFDPFHIGLTRLLHLDGLISSLMFLAVVSFLCFNYQGRRWYDLLLATFATGFAWLTKSPSIFLVPFFGLVSMVAIWNGWHQDKRMNWDNFWHSSWPFLVVVLGAALIFIVFWPSMWVNPIGTLTQMFDTTSAYALEGHTREVFFSGRIVDGDPGWLFYPINYLWRTTPGVLAGLALALLAFFKRWSPLEEKRRREIAVLLVLDALLFAVMMSLGAKKFDRYIIPSFPPLDLVAGIGWAALLGWVWGRPKQPAARWAAVGLGVLVIGSQVFLAGRTYPYYLTYYNPLLGGSAKAPEVMMIGWGEGLDQAARYINSLPKSERMKVMSLYPPGSVSYILNGEAFNQPPVWEGPGPLKAQGIDYMIIYRNQIQRQLPDPAMLNYFAGQEPEYEVLINGLLYAQVYPIW